MTIVRDSSYVDQARAYAQRDWQVVALHGIRDDGSCTCAEGSDCPAPGKHPRPTAWPQHATCDADAIQSLWRRWPDANVGVRLGPTSGIVDVEYDSDEGKATAERLLGDCFTPTFRSARSTHRLFSFPEDLAVASAVVKIEGLEIRLGGSKAVQSVFPPSRHASGVVYQWLDGLSPDDVDVLPFPDSLRDLIAKATAESNGNGSSFVMANDCDLASHPGADQGERYETLCRLVGGYLHEHGPDADLLPKALAWAERCRPPFTPDEVGKVVSGLVEKELMKSSATAAKQPAPSLALRPLASVDRRPVQWLWRGRLPLGKLGVIAGDGDVGKTTLACDLAARLSRGEPLPGHSEGQIVSSIFISAEDGDADTIRHRVEIMGGDLDNVFVLAETHIFDTFRSDIAKLKQAVQNCENLGLVIFDTLPDFIGESIDDHKNSGVRQGLRELIQFAADCNVAILGVAHFNKMSQGNSGHRLLGSVAYRNLPRSVLYLLHDPDDSDRRILFHEKSNLAPKSPTLALSLVANAGEAATIEWEPGFVNIDDIGRYLNASGTKKESKLNKASNWLNSYLPPGSQAKVSLILGDGSAEGHARPTLYRAAEELGIAKLKNGMWERSSERADVFRF